MHPDAKRLEWLAEFATEIYADEESCVLTYCLSDGNIYTVECEDHDFLWSNIAGAIDMAMEKGEGK